MTLRKACLSLLGWGLICTLLAPLLQTIWVSFSPDSFLTPPTTDWSIKWYVAFFQDHRWSNALLRSLFVATFAALLSVSCAGPAAWAYGRLPRSGQRSLAGLLLLPAIIPPAALGFGLLPLVHWSGLWGTTLCVVLVHATIGLPIAFLVIRTCMTTQLSELESAAAGLGANPLQLLWRVTLPLLRPALYAATTAVFVLSLNESLISIFLATPTNETLPTVIWPQLRYSANPMVAVASCLTALIGMTGTCILFRFLQFPKVR